ncbi:MAG: membrane protein required for beta-lactamase induction [Psychroserpens sp.]|jgi:membrane protein required for beta-lactamase induction
MNKELQGLFLCLAVLGLAYTVLMLLLMMLTSIKLFKTISLVFTLSTVLFTLGLSKQVKFRIKKKLLEITSSKAKSHSASQY